MKKRIMLFAVAMVLAIVTAGCILPGPPETTPPPKVPVSYTLAANQKCLGCHGDNIKGDTTKNANILPAHRKHLESSKLEFECTQCHESWVPATGMETRGIVRGGILHPVQKDWTRYYVFKPEMEGKADYVTALTIQNPNIFKPDLNKLVCTQCHGAESKIKALYGVP
ncbi:MAG: hypothetical protein HY930_02205 [Euryarchaeota archaeon]|nr:hypothetical protein [Euryarchaeota archaeon]